MLDLLRLAVSDNPGHRIASQRPHRSTANANIVRKHLGFRAELGDVLADDDDTDDLVIAIPSGSRAAQDLPALATLSQERELVISNVLPCEGLCQHRLHRVCKVLSDEVTDEALADGLLVRKACEQRRPPVPLVHNPLRVQPDDGCIERAHQASKVLDGCLGLQALAPRSSEVLTDVEDALHGLAGTSQGPEQGGTARAAAYRRRACEGEAADNAIERRDAYGASRRGTQQQLVPWLVLGAATNTEAALQAAAAGGIVRRAA
mmetsp:Transcript_69756/g.202416  ORF Transcript_69756/g.202416 Transcript_69756/m.202416 type:complete len:262 (-) Transcript_69756:417-1202(-)